MRFTKGIDFDFGGSAIETVEPGAYVLAVKNRAAFEARYGPLLPVAGEYTNDNLRNSGERLKLSFGAGSAIHDINPYSDALPWPPAADGNFSLVLRGVNEALPPDHNDPESWRISRYSAGSPGSGDDIDYDSWREQYNIADDLGDEDGDGIVSLLEFFLGGDPHVGSQHLLPVADTRPVESGGEDVDFLTLTFSREIAADQINYVVEFSSDLVTWVEGSSLLRQDPSGNDDGLLIETWRSNSPATEELQLFARLRVWR